MYKIALFCSFAILHSEQIMIEQISQLSLKMNFGYWEKALKNYPIPSNNYRVSFLTGPAQKSSKYGTGPTQQQKINQVHWSHPRLANPA